MTPERLALNYFANSQAITGTGPGLSSDETLPTPAFVERFDEDLLARRAAAVSEQET